MKKLGIAAALLALTTGASAQQGDGIELSDCHIKHHSQEVRCGIYTVFENRSEGSGREIDIHFAVLPAIDETVEPDPVVVFAGGPGQSAVEMAQFVRSVFADVNQRRDLVLIDQRGMGASHPLSCDIDDDELSNLNIEEGERRMRELLTECREALDADVTLYTQDLANADIHEILGALGYDRVNLFGASWGTRSALLYAHQFPDHVRTLVLDGNLPLDNPAPAYAAADGERAARALFADCAADPSCHEAFPGLEDDFVAAMERIGSAGVSVAIDDPTTGEREPLLLTQDAFGDVLRSVLYAPALSRIVPLLIEQAAQGDYRALLGVSSMFSEANEGSTLGASLTIFCSEELPRAGDADVDPGAGRRLLRHGMLNYFENACRSWPAAPLPDVYNQDVGSDAPALLLSGELDPITPPRWGEAMARALPNSLHLIATGTGHNVSPVGCAPDLITEFIDQGNLEGLDGSCLGEIKRPSFFIHASGPAVTIQ